MLVSTSLLSLWCPIMVENMAEGEPRLRLGAVQGKGECRAQNHFHPKPW
jgi:hypothetical protein